MVSTKITYPRLSIVTPSYNCGHYIERTISSVVDQNYPNLEYLVIDGASTDSTVEILTRLRSVPKYAARFKWISEKDNGQTDAINKGLRMCTGDWFAFLNADDYYEPGALLRVGEEIAGHPNSGVIHGNCYVQYDCGAFTEKVLYDPLGAVTFENMSRGNIIFGPTAYFNMNAIRIVGEFDTNLYYWMDYDMFLRIIRVMPFHFVNCPVTTFRIRLDQKSPSDPSDREKYRRFHEESYRVWLRNGGRPFTRLFFKRFVVVGWLVKFMNEHIKRDRHYLEILKQRDKAHQEDCRR